MILWEGMNDSVFNNFYWPHVYKCILNIETGNTFNLYLVKTIDVLRCRCTIDLSGFEEEKTHSVWKDLEDGAGSIFLLITISGTMGAETISDLSSFTFDSSAQRNLISKFVSCFKFFFTGDIALL